MVQAQNKEEDYDVNKESTEQTDKPFQPRKQQQRGGDRDNQNRGDRRQNRPMQGQGQGNRRDAKDQQSYMQEEMEPIDDLPLKPSQRNYQRYDEEQELQSRTIPDEDFTPQQQKERQKEDIEYFKRMQNDIINPINNFAEDYSTSEYGKLQNQLMALIKEKIDNNDRERAQKFVTQIRALYESTASLKFDEGTLAKIEELFINRKAVTDRDLIAEGIKQDALNYEKVAPSLSDYKGQDYIPGRDTFKDEPIAYEDYDQFVMEQMIEANNLSTFHNEENSEHISEVVESYDEYSIDNVQADEFDQYVSQIREDLYDQAEAVSSANALEVVQIQDQFNDPNAPPIDPQDRSFALILNSIATESTTLAYRLEKQFGEIMRQKGINHDEKEDVNQLIPDMENLNDKNMAEIGRSLQIQHEIENEVNFDIAEELKMQFDQTQLIMKMNVELRKRLVSLVRQARNNLRHVQNQRDKLNSLIDSNSKEHTTHAIPNGIFSFSYNFEQVNKKQQVQILNNLFKERHFSQSSTDIKDYNHELNLLINLHELQKPKERAQTVKMIGKVLNQMKEKKVQPDHITNLRLFEYGVISKNQDYANQKLKDLVLNKEDTSINIPSISILNKFYKQSLRSDNFAGLSHLINYVEKQQLDINQWSLSQFQSALNFYLNHTFDLSKLLTFTRYYMTINDCRLEKSLMYDYNGKAIEELTDIQKRELHTKVFNESDSLIDMRSLFSVMVDKVGEKDAVDPYTKQDVLWSLIDFFTKRGMADLMSKGTTNYSSLNERDIAKYFKNHINGTKTFERATNVVLRFDGKSDSFQNQLIQILKEYQANNNGSMPYSFEPVKVRNTYQKLKNAQDKQTEVKFSEKTAEYFLEMFTALKMWPEVSELCQNFQRFTGQKADTSELRSHYLTNATLNLPQEQHYYKAIQQSVYNGKEELNPGYITSMTKAYLQDGSIQHGIKFFVDSVEKLGQIKKDREDYLVSMFDSVFGQEAAKDLSYDQFKDKYLQTILMSEQSLKEAKAYTTLREAIQDKSYNQIQDLLNMYLVQSEEVQMLQTIRDRMDEVTKEKLTLEKLQQTPLEEFDMKYIKEEELDRLEAVRDRHQALKAQLDIQDYNKVIQLKNIMGDQKFNLMSGLKNQSADEIQELFNIRSQEEIDEMMRRSSHYYEAAQTMTSSTKMTIMDLFHEIKQQKIQDLENLTNPDPPLFKFGEERKQQGKTGQIATKTSVPAAQEDTTSDDDEEGSANGKGLLKEGKIEPSEEEIKALMKQMRVSEDDLKQMTDEDLELRISEFMQQMDDMFEDDDDGEEEGTLAQDQEEDADVDMDEVQLAASDNQEVEGVDEEEVTDDEEDYDDETDEDQEEMVELIENSDTLFADATKNKFKITKEDIEAFKEDKNFDQEMLEELEQYVGKTIDMRKVADKSDHERIDPSTWANLQALYSTRADIPQERMDETMDQALLANYEVFEDENIDDPYDESVIEREAHNKTVVELQEDLLKAVNGRRKDVLQIAVQLFNQMQDKKVPMKKLNKLDRFNEKTADQVDINETIDLCEKLLQDQRSPLLSALNTFAQYKDNQIENNFDEVFDQYDNEMHDAEFDLEFELLTQKHLTALTEKVGQTTNGLRALNLRILQEQEKLNQTKQIKENLKKKKERQQQITQHLENRIRNLYDQYQKRVQGKNDIDFANELSREAKLDLLSDLFVAEYDNTFTNNLFPAFYSQDLIIFGLQNNIPEAVRLGEQMMSQNGQTLPREMQVAVREYMLSNSDKYRKAVKNTGPIDNASLYKQLNNSRRNNETPVMMIADDPYWINLQKTTYKRSEAWRRPSALAVDYKRQGFMSEIAPHFTEDYIKQQTQYLKNMF